MEFRRTELLLYCFTLIKRQDPVNVRKGRLHSLLLPNTSVLWVFKGWFGLFSEDNSFFEMSLRLPRMENDFSGFRQPNVRAKVWSFEPLWKFVSYDLDISPDMSPTGLSKKYSKTYVHFKFQGELCEEPRTWG